MIVRRPLSWVYGAGVAIDRRSRRVAKAPASARPRIVSIGNLEAGGNGKTPLAMWWLERATASGQQVAYVSRGYGGAAARSRAVTCVLPPAFAPADAAGLRLLAPWHAGLAREVGDEGALVVRRAPDASALFSADKRRAVDVAASLGVDTVVMDDGFQSWSVARHVDVVLLDARAPLDGGHLLPAGRLREKPSALRRADAVVFNGAATEAAVRDATAHVTPWLRPGIPVAGMTRSLAFYTPDGTPATPPPRLVVVSAIARPDGFVQALKAAGIEAAAHLTWRDHQAYDARDAARIDELARRESAGVITTEKDWMKLQGLPVDARVWIARLDVSLIGDPLPV